MFVVLLVAGNTGHIQFGFIKQPLRRQMAIVAAYITVLALEQVFRTLVVIEDALLPILVGMASFAFVAIAALVSFLLLLIILLVAGNALHFQLQLGGIGPRNSPLVASVALRLLMLVAQWELGIVMVEFRLLPIAIVVAGFAFFSQTSPMPFLLVILLVAGNAFRFQLQFDSGSRYAAFVATLAFRIFVLVAQRKFCIVMVEAGLLPPALVVTGFAFFA